MIRTRQLVLIACLTSLVSGPLAGCAASAIGDPDLGTDTDDVLANEDQVEDAGAEEADDDAPTTTRRDASVSPPKADSGVRDAGIPARDASVDAGSKPADASARKDSGTTPPKDAATTTPPKDAAVDASKPANPPASANSCVRDSECKNICIAIGILACCNTALNVCGCTWAPGAYCL